MFICLFFFVLRGGDTEPRNQYVTVTLIQGIQLNKSILQPKGGDCTDKYKSKTSIHSPDNWLTFLLIIESGDCTRSLKKHEAWHPTWGILCRQFID